MTLRKAMQRLDERERAVLGERFVLGRTLDEVGESFGICRERVRQIEMKALEKCRRAMGLRTVA